VRPRPRRRATAEHCEPSEALDNTAIDALTNEGSLSGKRPDNYSSSDTLARNHSDYLRSLDRIWFAAAFWLVAARTSEAWPERLGLTTTFSAVSNRALNASLNILLECLSTGQAPFRSSLLLASAKPALAPTATHCAPDEHSS
jgi:hypothetical protein